MKTTAYNLDADDFVVLEHVGGASVKSKDMTVMVMGGAIEVTYADNAAADAALADLIAALNDLTQPLHMDLGDTVRLRSRGKKNMAENLNYEVLRVPTDGHPYWTLLGNDTLTVYVYGAHEPLEKVA